MANKLLNTLTKPLASKIAWLGGATAGLTAALSAIGFLVARSHHELLGITDLVPVPPDTWTVEGAKFVYGTLLLIFTGIVFRWSIVLCTLIIVALLAAAANEKWLEHVQELTKSSVVQWSIILMTFAGLYVSIFVFVKDAGVLDLRVSPMSEEIEAAIDIRSTTAGIRSLQFDYAAQAILVFTWFLWLKLLPAFLNSPQKPAEQETSSSPRLPVWQVVLWFLFLILLFFVPVKYGRMVKSSNYFKVCLLAEPEPLNSPSNRCDGYEGWLLHKDKETVILYQPFFSIKPIQVFERKQVPHIQVFTFDSIFPAASEAQIDSSDQTTAVATPTPPPTPSVSSPTPLPPTPTAGASPEPGITKTPVQQAVLDMREFLRKLPDTLADGILPHTRNFPLLKSLVLADNTGKTIDSFTPVLSDETGYLQSPVWLSNDRILFVEVHDPTATLKTVTVKTDELGYNFSSEVKNFGSPPIQGKEPHLTPDGKFVVFRQEATIMQADLHGEQITPLITEYQVKEIIGVFPDSWQAGYYILFEPGELGNAPIQLANILDNIVVSIEPVSDDRWDRLEYLNLHDNGILYAKQETMGEQSIWNVYLRKSPEQEEQKLTNRIPGAKTNNNRFPAWSPDGSKIIYASE